MIHYRTLRRRFLRIALFLGSITGFLLTPAAPADAEENSTQFWADYNINYKIDQNWALGGDLGGRTAISNTEWNQFLIRPGVTYRPADWLSVVGGAALFSTLSNITENVNEFRLFQDANLRLSTIPLVVPFGRLRAEERFFFYETRDDDWYLRGRVLAGLQTKDVAIGTQTFFLQGIWEGFWSLAGEVSPEVFVDQTRIHAAFGHRFASGWRYELHYIWQKAREGSDQGLDLSIRILRLRVFHTPETLLKDS